MEVTQGKNNLHEKGAGGDCFLDHIAVAVKDLEAAVQVYEHIGLEFSELREEVPSQNVRTAFAPLDNRAHLELLESMSESGPIFDFIQKKGEGIHHICLRVPDVEAKSAELKSKGFRLIYDRPVPGAGGALVNFIHPKSTGGVLIELSQKSAP